MPAEPVSRRRRRFLRISARGLVILVLVIGTGLGWIVRKAHVQRDAVAAIKNAGAIFVTYDWQHATGSKPTHGEPFAPPKDQLR